MRTRSWTSGPSGSTPSIIVVRRRRQRGQRRGSARGKHRRSVSSAERYRPRRFSEFEIGLATDRQLHRARIEVDDDRHVVPAVGQRPLQLALVEAATLPLKCLRRARSSRAGSMIAAASSRTPRLATPHRRPSLPKSKTTGGFKSGRCFTRAPARQQRSVSGCSWMKDGGHVTGGSTTSLDRNVGVHPPGRSEDPEIAGDLGRVAGCLGRVVRELDRGTAVGARHLGD